MASKQNVERLLALPYFRQTFDQVVEPMTRVLGQEAYEVIYRNMMKLMMDHFVEVMSDEEVELLQQTYENPVFIKLQKSMQSMLPKMITWFEQNQELFDQFIETDFNPDKAG